ncbi:MAG: 16S rRNA (cytosine(967)-C(5))-methyltransferase RsmB [Blastocatellia bacterium AA13]|nr:MAG: 16S rRNA (cytosine(967)-C(5))-methyltransferase RsmB [Blastocatellia bacterium AA13]
MKEARTGKISISPARLPAFEILLKVHNGAYSSDLLAARQDDIRLPEDRALARELVLGVLRHQSTLDYFIELYADRAVSRLDTQVVVALRIGIYQIRYLKRVPHSAAVNESVNLVKRSGVTSAAGLVNAVLRKAAANIGDQPGRTIADSAQRRAVELSHPEWLIARWETLLGEEEATRLAQANNKRAGVSFRVNGCKELDNASVVSELERRGLTIRESAYVPGALILESGDPAILQDAMTSGAIYIQDEASQLVSLLVDPQPGERILDLCAAPGSKATHLASLTRNAAWIIACDVNPRRLITLTEISRRLNARMAAPIAMDGTRNLPFLSDVVFDRVLVDAPCTGTGTVRRNPEIKWRLSPTDPARLSGVQSILLERAAQVVKPGGRLVYSTCSLEREENEIIVERFLENAADFKLVSPDAYPDLESEGGIIRTFPHRHDMDGFFAAVFERNK